MKHITLYILILSVSVGLSQTSQDNDEIIKNSCSCISEIDLGLKRKVQFDKLKECIEGAITTNQIMSSLTNINTELEAIDNEPIISEKKEFNIVLNSETDYKLIEDRLLRECTSVKKIMTTSNTVSEVSYSDKKKAQEVYKKGMELYRAENFNGAIKQFEKAIRKDENFAFAYDMLGISYRKLSQFEKAVEAYDQSLELDPYGRMPLMNKPIAYALMNKTEEAIKGYLRFIEVFPEDPEGYYGIGRIYHQIDDYENALDSTMKSYLLYNEINSPYARDAEKNLVLYYNELKEKNQLDLFNRMAEKHNIKID